jgi:4-amino-4-deoxy-L-arabinose transferase-like glycosyltransferase
LKKIFAVKPSSAKLVIYISIFAFIIRAFSIFLFANYQDPEMWEFGAIARNLLSGIGYQYKALLVNVPSAHMPPGLPFLYYIFFLLLGDNTACYIVILFFNAVLSSVSILILYSLAEKLYCEKIGLYSALYASLSPILIFSSINFNSIIIYQILITLLYIYYIKIFLFQKETHKKENYGAVIALGIITGVFLYFRSEMLGFMLILFSVFIFSKKIKLGFIYIFISIIIISPWTIRNYFVFGKIIPVTTSFGYNLLMGHGGNEPSEEYKQKILELREDSTFEIRESELSYKIALDYIKSDPSGEALGIFKKIYSLWIVDTYREQSKHPLYLFIWLPTLLLFIAGLYDSLKNSELRSKLSFLMLYITFSTILVIVFFNIPRYQIQMSFVLIPTAMYGLEKLIYFTKQIKK